MIDNVPDYISDVRARVAQHRKIPPCVQPVPKGRRYLCGNVVVYRIHRRVCLCVCFRIQKPLCKRFVNGDLRRFAAPFLVQSLLNVVDRFLDVVQLSLACGALEQAERLHALSCPRPLRRDFCRKLHGKPRIACRRRFGIQHLRQNNVVLSRRAPPACYILPLRQRAVVALLGDGARRSVQAALIAARIVGEQAVCHVLFKLRYHLLRRGLRLHRRAREPAHSVAPVRRLGDIDLARPRRFALRYRPVFICHAGIWVKVCRSRPHRRIR